MKGNRIFTLMLVLIGLLLVTTACSIRKANPVDQVPTMTAQSVSVASPTSEPSITIIHLPLIQNNQQETSPSLVSETPVAVAELSPTSTSTPCAPPTGWVVYLVQSGDTLYDIGLRYGMKARAIQDANCLPDSTILVGQQIYVPYILPTSTSTSVPFTPTPPQTNTPTPVTPSPTPIPPELLGQIFFNPGGGNIVPICATPVSGGSLQITSSERIRDMYELCIFGFPMNEQVSVELYAPDNHLVASKSFTVSVPYNDSTIIRVPLWMPVGMPLGTWSASARSAQTRIEGQTFLISPFGGPAINTEPVGDINPFEKHKCDTYPLNSNLIIRGTNFGSIQTVPIGLYLWTPNIQKDESGNFTLPLVGVQLASVSNGEFSIPIGIGSSDSAGTYWVIPVTDLEEAYYKVADTRNDCYKVP